MAADDWSVPSSVFHVFGVFRVLVLLSPVSALVTAWC